MEPIEAARLKFEAFDDGFKGDTLAQNFTTCYDNFLVAQYFEFPTFMAKVYYSSGPEYVSNTTSFLKNITYPLN